MLRVKTVKKATFRKTLIPPGLALRFYMVFGVPLGAFWGAFGIPWGALGEALGSLLGALGRLGDALGGFCARLGAFGVSWKPLWHGFGSF